MTLRQFYDWQTRGGVDDVTRLLAALERARANWCVIGGVAVNHWAGQPMVTQDVDLIVAADAVDQVVALLEEQGSHAERFPWSVNLRGRFALAIQLSTKPDYQEFLARAVAADVHGFPLRIASLEDPLRGKIRAWRDAARRQSKRIKDLADIARLVEAHSELWHQLPPELQGQIQKPESDGRTFGGGR